MYSTYRSAFFAASLLAVIAANGCSPASDAQERSNADSTAAASSNGIVQDLLSDVLKVEEKFLSLARAIPADKYSWRPGAGVRSIDELMLHVAADNYLIPAALGNPADSSTGIKGDDYNTAVAFEKRKMGRDSIVAELEKSFAFLKKSMTGTPAGKLQDAANLFGLNMRVQQALIMATTHLHEHLGQAIAYARVNSIVPPWSK